MRRAVIEVGSNSIKLLVAEPSGSGLREVLTRVRITRLSRGLIRGNRLSGPAMDRTLETLSEYRYLAEKKGAEEIRAVGTEVLRTAKNTKDFLLRCEYEAGIVPKVLPAREEARLSFLGGTSGLGGGAAVAIDIGGASTEVMIGLNGKLGKFWSLPTGVVLLTEKHLRSDPPSEKNLRSLAADIAKRLDKIQRYRGKAQFVAIGGTAATMVSMMLKLSKISGKRIHGRRMTLDSIGRTMDRLTELPLAKRRKVKGLEPDRADIILSGLAFLIGAANHFEIETVTASARGLRQGLLL